MNERNTCYICEVCNKCFKHNLCPNIKCKGNFDITCEKKPRQYRTGIAE